MHAYAAQELKEKLAQTLFTRGLLTRCASWFAFQGGRTNRVWRVTRPDGDVVVKLYAGETCNPLFPNDPESEALILKHLHPYGLAPLLLDHFSTEIGQCLVYEHVEGETWTGNAAGAAELLFELHRITPPHSLRKTPNGSGALRRQTEKILDLCLGDRAKYLRTLRPKIEVTANPVPQLLHGDPVPANLIGYADRLCLIDWQCPAIGDPCEDLSIFLSPAMQLTYRGQELSAAEIHEFLKSYSDTAIMERYQSLAPWYHWRMAAYCLWKECTGDPKAAVAGQAELLALERAQSEYQ